MNEQPADRFMFEVVNCKADYIEEFGKEPTHLILSHHFKNELEKHVYILTGCTDEIDYSKDIVLNGLKVVLLKNQRNPIFLIG